MRFLPITALLLAGAALAGCSASPPAPSPGSSVDPAALDSSYIVKGGGQYVQGGRDMCDLLSSDPILIEDEKSLDGYNGKTPVTSITLSDGKISYSTIWPDEKVGTGISEGSGTYTINADSTGRPTSISGRATVVWHDQASDSNTKRTDNLTFTVTAIATPAYCNPAG